MTVKSYKELSVYQYTLALKHSQMRLMLTPYLAPEKMAQEAAEFAAKTNRDLEALHNKYLRLRERTHEAYALYLVKNKGKEWTTQQCNDYWNRVISGLQNKWPVHWLQELFALRNFDDQTDFSSEDALKALPEAKYCDRAQQLFYPSDQGYYGAIFYLRSYPPTAKLDNFVPGSIQLIQQGDQYFVYGPCLSDDLEKAIDWELKKLDPQLFKQLPALPFSHPPIESIPYSATLKPLYLAMDRALGGPVMGSDFGFDFAALYWNGGVVGQGSRDWWTTTLHETNLEILTKLNGVRTAERDAELVRVKEYLAKPESEKAVAPKAPAPSWGASVGGL